MDEPYRGLSFEIRNLSILEVKYEQMPLPSGVFWSRVFRLRLDATS